MFNHLAPKHHVVERRTNKGKNVNVCLIVLHSHLRDVWAQKKTVLRQSGKEETRTQIERWKRRRRRKGWLRKSFSSCRSLLQRRAKPSSPHPPHPLRPRYRLPWRAAGSKRGTCWFIQLQESQQVKRWRSWLDHGCKQSKIRCLLRRPHALSVQMQLLFFKSLYLTFLKSFRVKYIQVYKNKWPLAH